MSKLWRRMWSMPGPARSALAVWMLLAWFVAPGLGQEFRDDDEKRFYQEYLNRLEVSDLLGVGKLVERSGRVAEGVLDALCNQYAMTPSPERLEEMRPLATALDNRPPKGEQYTKRIEYLAALDPETHQKRRAAIEGVIKAVEAYDRARQSKERADLRQALMLYGEALQATEGVKDLELVSFCRFRLGHCHESLGEYMEAVLAYDKAMDEWNESGRSSEDPNYQYMVSKRRELIDKGYDPTSPPSLGGSGEPAKNTSTAYAEGSNWEDHSTEYKLMRSPDSYTLPSPFSASHHLLWRQFGYSDGTVSKLEHWSACQPFGTPLQVCRDGSKGAIDVDQDGQGDVPAKILDGKPNVVEVQEGDDRSAPKYGLFLLTGGQNQQWLGHSVGYQDLGFYRVASYREGEVHGVPFLLFDDNATGAFGDFKEMQDGVQRGYPKYMELDAMILGKGKQAVPYSDIARIGDAWYRIKPGDLQCTTLRTRQLNLETGTVRVEWEGPNPPVSLVIAEVRELNGAFFEVAGKKPVEVPVGRYQVAIGKLESGKKTSLEQAWILPGKSEPFEVKPGEETVLPMGAEYRFEFKTRDNSDSFVVEGKSILIYDRMECLIGRIFPEVVRPDVEIETESGGSLARGKEMRLITTDAFGADSQAAWFPADFVLEKASGTKVHARLTMKKHDLLGGPFTSDWEPERSSAGSLPE